MLTLREGREAVSPSEFSTIIDLARGVEWGRMLKANREIDIPWCLK